MEATSTIAAVKAASAKEAGSQASTVLAQSTAPLKLWLDFWNVRSVCDWRPGQQICLFQDPDCDVRVRDAFKLLRECLKPALTVDGGQEGPGALGLVTLKLLNGT